MEFRPGELALHESGVAVNFAEVLLNALVQVLESMTSLEG